jgi:uncharacterized protein (TIGR02453 family)
MDISRSYSFLTQLSKHNNKAWFDKHRDEYNELKRQLQSFAFELMDGIADFDTSIKSPSDIKIFRINRDIRFSKNKDPYKTNFGITIAPSRNMQFNPGYHIFISPTDSFVAAGWYGPDSSLVPKIRTLISQQHKEFQSIVTSKSLRNGFPEGLTDIGDSLKRPPRGFDAEDPALEYLKLKHWVLSTRSLDFEESQTLVKDILKILESGYELNAFLRKAHDISV